MNFIYKKKTKINPSESVSAKFIDTPYDYINVVFSSSSEIPDKVK
ncbi:UNVERIFIED_CONTAM: hypothetical protein O8I53_08010 [Campylobacter lari]